MDQALDAMRLRTIRCQLDRDGDVLGCAVERSVAQRRGRPSECASFDATLRHE